LSVIVIIAHRIVVATFIDNGPEHSSAQYSAIASEIITNEYSF